VLGTNNNLPGPWRGGGAPLQPCQHVLDGLPYPFIIRVSRRLECGSHAAAAGVHMIRRGLQRTPVPVRAPDDGNGRTQAGSLPYSVLVQVVCRVGFRRGSLRKGGFCRGGF
jgi:hypothetical protein